MAETIIPVPGRFEPREYGTPLAHASAIYDETQNKSQSEINTMVANIGTIDSEPTEDSQHAVSSGGVYTELEAMGEDIHLVSSIDPGELVDTNNPVAPHDYAAGDMFYAYQGSNPSNQSKFVECYLYYVALQDGNQGDSMSGNLFLRTLSGVEALQRSLLLKYEQTRQLLNSNYVFAGVADSSLDPGNAEGVFYLATRAGSYTHFLDEFEEPLNVDKGLSVLFKGVGDAGWSREELYNEANLLRTIFTTVSEYYQPKGNYQPAGDYATEQQLADKANASDVYTKSETYNKTEINSMITTTDQEYLTVVATAQTTAVTDLLPATGAADTIYRVGCWDGSQYDDTCYSEYAWKGDAYVKLSTKNVGIDDEPTAGSDNLVESGGVYSAIRGILWQSIKGNGNTFVWSDGVDVIAGNTYRCVLKNKNVDMTGVTAGGRFVVNTAQDFSNPLVYIPFGTSLSDYYDITIPDNVNTLYFGCRCAINEDFDVLFVDTTIIKSLSNNVLTVAAYDSSDVAKANADIVATALNKGTNAINLAISLLPNGGRIYLRNGNYNGDTTVNINTNNIVIEGESLGAVVNNISGNGIVISNGNTGEILKTLTVNAVNGTPMYYDNVVVGTLLKHTKGSSYDFIIAASNSSDYSKSIADYICDGTADDVEINTAIGLLTNGGAIRLCDGTYNVASQISIGHSNITIEGGGQGTVINSTIAGTNTVILTQNNSNNVYVKNINLGAKFTSLNNSGSGYVVNCIVGGKLVAMKPWPDMSLVSSYNYVIAASDAPEEFKKIASAICTGTGDDTIIYNYISGLTNGGAILLSPGTFNLNSYIALRKSGVMLCGCGFATKIERSSVLALRVTEDAVNTVVKDINFGSHTIELEYGSGYGYAYNCWFNNQHYHNFPNQDNTVYVSPSQGIDGINAAIRNFALKGVCGKIKLGIGEYGGTDGIRTQYYIDSSTGTVYANGVEIEGCGYATYINRNSVNNSIIFSGTITEDHIKFSNLRIKQLVPFSATLTIKKDIIFRNVWVGEKYYKEYAMFYSPVINVGDDYSIKTLYDFIQSFASSLILPNEVHLYGVQKMNDIRVMDNIYGIRFVGHDAHLILKPTNGNIQFSLSSNGCVFEDIVFEKRGCSNYWNIPCFTINANVYDATFINCKFINNSSSPTPFNPAEASVGDESYIGGRRHGIYIDSAYYGEDCKVAFYNCVGQGSPYGHQNTRGWYISYGEPKLYNCIGYGGGVGEYGHGIVCHRNSKPMLFNFVGYAGNQSYRMAAGIRTQAGGSPTMINCVGYGGCHLQYKSEGVPYSTLHDRCVEIGISDESFFYDGSTVNYSGLTLVSPDDGHNEDRTKLLAVLDSDDVIITSLGTNSYKNYGIGLWYGQQKFKMINCIGYAGGGENSCGLIMEGKNIPTIVGGYFGIEDLSDDVTYINDAGHNYMTFLPDGLNTLTPYTVTGAVVIRGTYPFVEGDKIHIETDEATPKVICDSPYTSNNILPLDVTPTNVDAGVKLKVYVVNNGVIKSVADSGFGFKLTYNYNGLNTRALSVGADAKPKITGSHFETNAASPVIEALCSNDEYSISNCTVVSRGNEDAVVQGQNASDIRMFACVIKGTVDSSVTFAQTESVNNSSNIKVI